MNLVSSAVQRGGSGGTGGALAPTLFFQGGLGQSRIKGGMGAVAPGPPEIGGPRTVIKSLSMAS